MDNAFYQLWNFLQDLFYLKYMPNLNDNASFGVIFIFGILTSFHCLGMCGGIVISQAIGDTKRKGLISSLLYNFGRVISYTIVGGAVGGIGKIFALQGILKGAIPIIGGIFMIIMGINLLGIFPALRRFNIRMPIFFAKKLKGGNSYSPFYVGLVSGLMPCGPLQIIQLYALGTRSVIFGALSSFMFSIGTIPVLFAFGAFNAAINKRYSKAILKFSAALVIILGIAMIGRGTALSGVHLSHTAFMTSSDEKHVANIEGKIQTVKTEMELNTYPTLVVQKDLPVIWIMESKEENITECNNSIVISKFNVEEKIKEGENIIEFTPSTTGEIVYSCWMGMIKGKIIVVDNLESSRDH